MQTTYYNPYQEPSFKFETSVAVYDVQYDDTTLDDKKWKVRVEYKLEKNVIGNFELPIMWSREYVFTWLSRLEINEVKRQ